MRLLAPIFFITLKISREHKQNTLKKESRGEKGRTHPPAGDRNHSSGKPGQTSEKKQPDALSGNSSRRYYGRYGFLRLYGKRLRCGRNKGRRRILVDVIKPFFRQNPVKGFVSRFGGFYHQRS